MSGKARLSNLTPLCYEGYPAVRHLTAVAKGLWLVCFDSLSHLSDELANAACRPTTDYSGLVTD